MEKFSSLTRLLHMSDDFCYLNFVFFFGVLFVEDAIILADKIYTAKAVGAIFTVETERTMRTIDTVFTSHALEHLGCFDAFVAQFTIVNMI